MKRLLSIVLLCMLLCPHALGELPQALRQVTTIQEAKQYIDFAMDEDEKELARDVQAGRIRHISQVSKRKGFCTAYWKNNEFNLIARTSPSGRKYGYYAGNMCTRAVYCEMLSYFGIDLTPVAMSSLMNSRNVDNPYDSVTPMIYGLVRTPGNAYTDFDEMFARYQSDTRYSPVMLMLRDTSDSSLHSVLVVGVTEEGSFICVDSAYHSVNGKPLWVFPLKLTKNRSKVYYSPVSDYNKMTVRACYQWFYEPN